MAGLSRWARNPGADAGKLLGTMKEFRPARHLVCSRLKKLVEHVHVHAEGQAVVGHARDPDFHGEAASGRGTKMLR
jgi:hypothetical protein